MDKFKKRAQLEAARLRRKGKENVPVENSIAFLNRPASSGLAYIEWMDLPAEYRRESNKGYNLGI
ncbi:hypothetical protein C8R44DRAFT_812412 [Mycena epipterygia]|nr:hypothetical protein C8R44DRAFT_812412 [Mycena epipterygia]